MKKEIILVGIISFMEHDMKEPVLRYTEIKNNLHTLQGIVGGNIEIPYMGERMAESGICMIINDSGKLEGLAETMIIVEEESRKILDTINGSVIFASVDEDGELDSLTEEQQNFIDENIGKNVSVLMNTDLEDFTIVHKYSM